MKPSLIKKAHVLLPDVNAVIQCTKLATTSEAALYIAWRLEEKLKDAGKLNEAQAFLQKIKEHLEQSALRSGDHSNWKGQRSESSIVNYYKSIEQKTWPDIKRSTPDDIILEIALSDTGAMLRTYTHNNQVLDDKTIERLDEIFKSWLVKNNYGIQEGRIYSLDTNHSEKIKPVNSKEILALLYDENKGLAKIFEGQSKNLIIQERNFEQAIAQAQELEVVPE